MSALYNKICLLNVPQNAWFCIYIQITRVCGTPHLDQKLCYTVLLVCFADVVWLDGKTESHGSSLAAEVRI